MKITTEMIEKMSYVEFISMLEETNRCPGGKNTIRRILQNTFINHGSKVLEVGSNTGFTTLEIARIAGCSVTGIDVVPDSIRVSRELLSKDTPQVRKLVKFKVGSAYKIPFRNSSFDVVVAGGATSFMEDKGRAVKEYHRVLKPWGFLSVTTLAYVNRPPASTLKKLFGILGVKIQPWNFEEWMRVFSSNSLFETYHSERFRMHPVHSRRISEFVDYFLGKPHIKSQTPAVKKAIAGRWTRTMDVFNENHRYLGILFVIFRKRYLAEEPELFTEYTPLDL